LFGPTFRAGFLVVALAIGGRAQSVTCTNATATPVTIRAEGLTEQVADVSFTCNSTGSLFNVTAFLSDVVTSAPLGSSGLTEAAIVTSAGSVLATVNGSVVASNNVPMPAGSTTVTITNVRVNATESYDGATVTESVFIGTNGLATSVFNNISVALIQPGLAAGTGGSQTFAACTNMTPASGPAFLVLFGENFPTAFKTQGGPSNNTLGSEFTANTETGYFLNVGGATNQASSGTRIRILFNDVPPGAAPDGHGGHGVLDQSSGNRWRAGELRVVGDGAARVVDFVAFRDPLGDAALRWYCDPYGAFDRWPADNERGFPAAGEWGSDN
jgi:hypothetical protein